MRKHIIKKEITTVIFMLLLFAFAAVNFMHTLPYFKDVETNEIDELGDIQDIIVNVENIMNENVYSKYTFVEAYGLWNLILAKKEVDGFSHIKDDNGYLHYSDFWNDQSDDIDELVNTVLALRDKVEENGTEVIVLMPPVKDDEASVTYGTGMPYCDKNWIADEYLSKLAAAGVNVLDFRETLDESGMSYDEMFYVTDHHWTTQAVFVCYQEFVKQMEAWYDIELDPTGLYTDINNYNVLLYEDATLGSHGRDTGIVYAGGLDDFTLMYPKYYTNFTYTWEINEMESVLNGRFEDTMVSTYNIINSNVYGQDKYAAYMNGIDTYDNIVNNDNTEAPKVLFLRDSCTSPFAAFASQVFSETDLIWTYKLNNDLEEYVDIEKYDYIIVSLYPDSLKDNMFQFNLSESE